MSDIDTAAADSLKVLDPERPIREADIERPGLKCGELPISDMVGNKIFVYSDQHARLPRPWRIGLSVPCD